MFKCIFLNENVRISIKISLKFVPKCPINNIPALVQIMAWRRPGDKPLSEPMMVCLSTHICVTRPQWVKDIMNKKKSKVEFPTYFLNNGKYVSDAKNSADKFIEYFIEIGPSPANEIDVSNTAPFHTYLSSPCTSSFHFQYTNPSDLQNIIQGLKPTSSAGYDHLSSKVLKDIAGIISTPLSIIVNQSFCSGIFPSKLKIAKVIPLLRVTFNYLEIIARFLSPV